MSFKDFYKREKYVAIHAQSWRFRVVKYVVLAVVAYVSYAWKGAAFTGFLFLWLCVAAIVMHFLFRWKTQAWTQSWGPYKRIPLDGE